MNPDQIAEVIHEAVCTSLALGSDEVTLQSRLFDDLGMDSLDFLDIIFAVEKQCSVRLRNDDIAGLLRGPEDDPDAMEQVLTGPDLNQILPFFPAIVAEGLTSVQRKQLFSYMTLETLVILVAQKAAES